MAKKGLAGGRFWICGNGKTYGRIFGSVVVKGLKEEEVRLYWTSDAGKRLCEWGESGLIAELFGNRDPA